MASSKNQKTTHYMRIISWNVNGIRAVAKKGLLDIIADLNPDIMCFQETKAQPDQVQEVFTELEGYHVYANSAEKKGYSSTAIISKEEPISVVNDMGIAEHDTEGRVMAAEFADFYVVTVYTPNSKAELLRLDYRAQWDIDFANYVAALQEKKPVFVCGDLNVAHAEIDIARPKANYNKTPGYTQVEIDGLTNLLNKGMVDSWRAQHPDEVKYSWWSFRGGARQKNIGWRLDYFIVSESLMPKLTRTDILNEVLGSDHCPVLIEM